MADAVLSLLLDTVVIFIQNEASHVSEFFGQLIEMKNELQFMRSYLIDIDRVKNKDQWETLRMISQQLRELLYEAEDIIADCEHMLEKQQQQQQQQQCLKCITWCSPSFLIFRHQMGKKLKQINQKIRSLRESMRSYLVPSVTIPRQGHVNRDDPPARYSIIIEEVEIAGLKNDLKKIMNWIFKANGTLTTIGIVGIKGIGKTTLAQKVYYNDNVKCKFDHTLVMVVSQSIELKEIVKDMLRKLDVNEDLLMKDEVELIRLLHDELTGKYLLIFDDKRTDGGPSWWKSLKSVLPRMNEGSCIIVTTTSEEVARSMGAIQIHHPQPLSNDDSWSLFSQVAFAREGGQCPNQELERIGKDIVAQCNGLPLAIKVVGGVMLGKGHSLLEWKNAFDHLKGEFAIHTKEESEVHKRDKLVFPTLRFSYEELPKHLKPCVLCLAAFPEGSEIDMDDVIFWWIGEGFAQEMDGNTAYEIALEWWDELVSRGLLLGTKKDTFEKSFSSCRVHGMVHDMIIKIAKEECFMGWNDRGNPSDIKPRRVSIMRTTTDSFFFPRLRTLVWRNFKESVSGPKWHQLRWLRVLDVEFMRNYGEKDDWLSGIGSFEHLICLKIKNARFEKLPDSIKNLQNLQVIYLANCPQLKTLPAQVTSLKKLTILGLLNCESLEYYPAGIGRLSKLEDLGLFKPISSRDGKGCCLSELRMLTQLRRLSIEIDSKDRIADEDLLLLSELEHLNFLLIKFEPQSSDEQRQLLQKVDYRINPCHKLQELHIWKFPGEKTPAWLNPITLPNLQFLGIHDGNMRRMHPSFFEGSQGRREIWKLKALSLEYIHDLEEEWKNLQSVMPSLKLLKVHLCLKLKNFPCNVNNHGIWRK